MVVARRRVAGSWPGRKVWIGRFEGGVAKRMVAGIAGRRELSESRSSSDASDSRLGRAAT